MKKIFSAIFFAKSNAFIQVINKDFNQSLKEKLYVRIEEYLSANKLNCHKLSFTVVTKNINRVNYVPYLSILLDYSS